MMTEASLRMDTPEELRAMPQRGRVAYRTFLFLVLCGVSGALAKGGAVCALDSVFRTATRRGVIYERIRMNRTCAPFNRC